MCDPQARLVPLWSSEHPSGSQIYAICLAIHCPARPHSLGTLPEEVRRAGWSLFRGNNSHPSLVWECNTREVIGTRSPAMVRRRNGTGWGRTQLRSSGLYRACYSCLLPLLIWLVFQTWVQPSPPRSNSGRRKCY